MSYKTSSNINNSIKLNCDRDDQWVRTPSLDTNVKLAGEEAKDRLYEPKHKKKLVRVLTVIAYIFFVSLAAIMLSLYYVFLWNGNQKDNFRVTVIRQGGQMQLVQPKCEIRLEQIPIQPESSPSSDNITSSSITTTTESSTTWPDYDHSSKFLNYSKKRDAFMKKLIRLPSIL